LKKKILINAVQEDCCPVITRYDDIRYSITVPDDFNIGFVCCITWVLIGIVRVIRLGGCLYVFQRLSIRRGRCSNLNGFLLLNSVISPTASEPPCDTNCCCIGVNSSVLSASSSGLTLLRSAAVSSITISPATFANCRTLWSARPPGIAGDAGAVRA